MNYNNKKMQALIFKMRVIMCINQMNYLESVFEEIKRINVCEMISV